MALRINWTETRPAGDTGQYWWGIYLSADGSKQFTGYDGGRLYYSSNSGTSWTEVQPLGNTDQPWEVYGISDDGTKLLAGVYDGRLYYSSNSGASWTEVQPAGDVNRSWINYGANCLSGDGTKILVSCANSGRLYYSSNSGSSWTEMQPAGDVNKNWISCTISDSGSALLAGVSGGRLYYSSNSGSSWTEMRPGGLDADLDWNGTTLSDDGTKLLVGTNSNAYYSTNSGVSWSTVSSPSGPNGDYCTGMSGDGLRSLITVYGARLYFSGDTFQSYAEERPAGDVNDNWFVPGLSEDGSKMAVVSSYNRVWEGVLTSSSDPTNTFSTTPARNGVTVTSTADAAATVALITGDSLFDSASKIARVDVHYVSPSGRQTAVITHTGHGLTGRTSWSSGAESGVWQKTRVVAFDADGARHVIDRATIGSGEDLTLA